MSNNDFSYLNSDIENCEDFNEMEGRGQIIIFRSDQLQIQQSELEIENYFSYHKLSQSLEKENNISCICSMLSSSLICDYYNYAEQCSLVIQFQKISKEVQKSSEISLQAKIVEQNRGKSIDKQAQHNFQKHLKTTINSILAKLVENKNLSAIERQISEITIKNSQSGKQYWKLFFFGDTSNNSLYEKYSLLQIVKTHGLQASKQAQRSLKVKIIQYFDVNKNEILINRKMNEEKKKNFLSYLEKFFSQIQRGRIVKRINRK